MDPVLGKLIDHTVVDRDAIHVAIIPLIAKEKLNPGTHISVEYNTEYAYKLNKTTHTNAVGIVDPFLKTSVKAGDRFYGVLYPGTVVGMRHHFQHPNFPDNNIDPTISQTTTHTSTPIVSPDEHKDWLINFCNEWYFNFDEVIEAAENQGYITVYGSDFGKYYSGEDYELFWEHVEGYLGRKFSDTHKDNVGWSCSC